MDRVTMPPVFAIQVATFGSTSRVVEVGLPNSLPAYGILLGLSLPSPERRHGKIGVNGT